jgi:hypothetical protein
MDEISTNADISHVKTLKAVTINDDQEVRISEEAEQRFFFRDPVFMNDIAIKCSGCQMITVHNVISVMGVRLEQFDPGDNETPTPPLVSKRIVCCTYCAKITTK